MPRTIPSPPNLLLTFDAFGTLFKPKAPIAQQYGQVARSLGLAGFRDEHLHEALSRAFRAESQRHPNYGKATGLGATKWWTNVIHETFGPLVGVGRECVDRDLAPALIRRFSSREGYVVGEPHFLSALRAVKRRHLVVGVVTNSDDRVPSILTSFGFNVSPLRYVEDHDLPVVDKQPVSGTHDIDFHCISYDVGFEKPDRRIFRAAEDMLARVLATQDGLGTDRTDGDAEAARREAQTWQKVHVGDEYAKDVVGALDAGWSAVLLDEAGEGPDDLRWLEDLENLDSTANREESGRTMELEGMFGEKGAVRVRSLGGLMSWLGGASSC